MGEDQLEVVAVRLPEERKKMLRIEAAKRDTTMAEIGRDLIEDWLEEAGSEPPDLQPAG